MPVSTRSRSFSISANTESQDELGSLVKEAAKKGRLLRDAWEKGFEIEKRKTYWGEQITKNDKISFLQINREEKKLLDQSLRAGAENLALDYEEKTELEILRRNVFKKMLECSTEEVKAVQIMAQDEFEQAELELKNMEDQTKARQELNIIQNKIIRKLLENEEGKKIKEEYTKKINSDYTEKNAFEWIATMIGSKVNLRGALVRKHFEVPKEFFSGIGDVTIRSNAFFRFSYVPNPDQNEQS